MMNKPMISLRSAFERVMQLAKSNFDDETARHKILEVEQEFEIVNWEPSNGKLSTPSETN